VGTFLSLMTGMLVAFGVTDLANDQRRASERLRKSELVAAMAAPIPGPASPRGPARDVYVLVLDQYANQDVLREFYGYDNGPFLDSLRALGFHVPAVSRSNYTHTMLSIPSMLNAAHLTPVAAEQGRKVTDPTIPNYLTQHSRVATYLQERGYRYVFFPSRWWLATSGSPWADVEPQVWGGTSLLRALGRTELRRSLLRSSVVPERLVGTLEHDADHVRRTLRAVADARRFGSPVFVVAHIISPHPPYAVTASCEPSPKATTYLAQLECVNRQILDLAGELIRSSPVAPIIVLQGDHGSKSRRFSDYPSAAAVPADAARERFGAFGAYYLPNGGANAFGDTVTVVNVLGNVLRYYFGARLPRAADDQYLSVDRAPFDFRRVDPAGLTPPRITVREASTRKGGPSR
ncbi:MAG TPA: sulfatase-like hydrolase/transferase, partial [Gemmatimonadales bacterium]|nr:sulfatase-like hydrolase/transferase [Gemmatimonadales bacterium]